MTQPFNDQTLRIASYNIRKARGLDGRREPGRILDVLNKIEADIIALQEADRRLGKRPAALPKDMIERDTDFEVVPLAVNDVSLGWHGNALLVRRGTHILTTSLIPLPGVEPRGAVSIKLSNGMTIVGVHLGLLRSSRRRQLAAIKRHLGTTARSILIGDMNEWARDRGFEALARDFVIHSPGRSFHAARPLAALDRAALSHDLKLHDAGVDDGTLARKASDHLPIWVDVATGQPLDKGGIHVDDQSV